MAQTHRTIDRRKAKTDEQSVAKRLAEEKEQKKNAPASSVGAAAQNSSRGSYYSPREYGTNTGQYEARVTAAKTAMEERSAALMEQRKALEQARADEENKRKRYYDLSGMLEGEDGQQRIKQLEGEWTASVEAYGTVKTAYDAAYQEYRPYELAYNEAVNAYNGYVTAERDAYADWRGTIRDAEAIREEQRTLSQKRRELVNRMQYADQYGPDNEERIAELQAYLGGVGEREKLLQEELEWSNHFLYEDLRQNADFAAKSGYQSTATGAEAVWDNLTGGVQRSAFGDSTYDFVNRNPDAAREILNDQAMHGSPYNDMSYLRQMTDDEVALYNYVYTTQGAQAANGYLEHLRTQLTARQTQAAANAAGEAAAGSIGGAIAGSIGSVLLSPASGIQSMAGQLMDWATGRGIDPNAAYALGSNIKNAIREAVTAKVEEHAGPVGSFAYGTVMSMADMLADAASGNPTAAMAMIGSRAFSEQVIDAKNRGLSDGEALVLGVASGAAELITEKIGLDELLKLPKGWEDAGFWKGALKGALGEAGEEGITNVMNLAADIAVAGEKSEFAMSIERYKREGKDDEAALLAALKDAGISLGADMLGGAVSGGVFGGVQGFRGKKAAEAKSGAENATEVSDNATVREDRTVEGAATEGSSVVDKESLTTASKTETAQEPEVTGAKNAKAEGGAVGAGNARTEQEPVIENGGANNETAGERVLHGEPERHDGQSAREPDGDYAEHRERQQTQARSQAEAATQRRVKAENLEKLGRLQRVSARDLGLKRGTQVQELLELPRYEWDQELHDTVSRLEKETGYKVRTVTGNIGIRNRDGSADLVRGYIDRVSGTVVLNVSHSTITAGQIADHELYHWKCDAVNRISGDRSEVTRMAMKRIREEFGGEDLDAMIDAYVEGYGDVYDMDDAEEFLGRVYEEIIADAYAGINAFGTEASRYHGSVNGLLEENGPARDLWNASEQEDVPAPGGDQRVYTDEDAPPMPAYEDYSQILGWENEHTLEHGEERELREKEPEARAEEELRSDETSGMADAETEIRTAEEELRTAETEMNEAINRLGEELLEEPENIDAAAAATEEVVKTASAARKTAERVLETARKLVGKATEGNRKLRNRANVLVRRAKELLGRARAVLSAWAENRRLRREAAQARREAKKAERQNAPATMELMHAMEIEENEAAGREREADRKQEQTVLEERAQIERAAIKAEIVEAVLETAPAAKAETIGDPIRERILAKGNSLDERLHAVLTEGEARYRGVRGAYRQARLDESEAIMNECTGAIREAEAAGWKDGTEYLKRIREKAMKSLALEKASQQATPDLPQEHFERQKHMFDVIAYGEEGAETADIRDKLRLFGGKKEASCARDGLFFEIRRISGGYYVGRVGPQNQTDYLTGYEGPDVRRTEWKNSADEAVEQIIEWGKEMGLTGKWSGETMNGAKEADGNEAYDPEDDWMINYSYGGENARSADREAMERAQRMEEQGFDKRQIFRETGWFRGADGKWRFEIDDSGMKYHRAGDAQFAKDHPEYARYKELEMKFIEGTISDAELEEMQRLSDTWLREVGRLAHRIAKGNATLANMLDHDALFEAYPQLQDVKVRFGDVGDDANGWWDKERNEIVFSDRLRRADATFLEGILLHEIQHAIQDMEGFAGGANPEYWERIQNSDQAIRENDREFAEAERDAQEALKGVPPEVAKDFWYAANMMETDPEGAQEIRDRLDESEYADAFWDYDWAVSTVRELLERDNPKRTAKDLYRNTAGEIEARDAANRRGLGAQERKERLPNTGGERTVFVETSAIPFSDNLDEYPYDMQTVIQEYLHSADMQIAEFVKEVREGKAWKSKKIAVGTVGDKMADDIKTVAGVNSTVGGNILLNVSAVEHILKRHGENGAADHSMKNDLDIARIDYVLQNYDDAVLGDSKSYTFRNRDNTPAKTVLFSKKINGTYFVVEAVPNTGKVAIVTAYINKKGTSQVPDADAPGRVVRNVLASVPNNNIPEDADNVKQDDVRFSVEDELTREDYDRLMAEVAGDQSKRNEEFIRGKLTKEQYRQFREFRSEDNRDAEEAARLRGIERFEKAMEQEDLAVLRAQQEEDAAAGRRELRREEKAAREDARAAAEKARQERKQKAEKKKEQARKEAAERIARAAENAAGDSAPTIARKELQDRLIGLFSVGEGQRGELRKMIGDLADRMIVEGSLDEGDLRNLINRLYDAGVMVIEPEEVYAEGRSYVKDEHIYISPELIRELGDDWQTLRKKAWGLGVYLSTDRQYAGLDVWNKDLASYLPGMFNESETDQRTMLERILMIAEEGKAERISLTEYTKRIAKAEHQSEQGLLFNLERQVEEALRTFAEKASLETRLKERHNRRAAMDREKNAIAREQERIERAELRQELADDREVLRAQNEKARQALETRRAEYEKQNATERRRIAEERRARREKTQQAKRKKELRELQQKTLNALQWIAKNRRKAPEAMQAAFDEVLGDIDLYCISMADEMAWSSKHQATWKDLKAMYLHAREHDPNFLPSEDLDRIVSRLDKTQLEELDFDRLRDLYQVAVGLRTEYQQRNNVISDSEWEMMEKVYSACVEEMKTAPKKLSGLMDRFLNLEQLTPMNVLAEMGGFNPNGMLYRFAKQLEGGERNVRGFTVKANRILADFLEENKDWVHKADGQGKDGKWIKCEIPELLAMKVGEEPRFGGTVTVWMTPMQRVHLYLESRNHDNLRHMTGGRTFADKELYSKGERQEAFAKGTTVRMAPETVQLLLKDMSQEEMELANLLDRYYNDLAKTEINKVSNVLLGYDKAMGGKYAPIFTNQNYTKSEFGKFDGTAEGAGNLKERVKSKVPSYNISALDAFERNMDRTATYVGMAIPVRNWNTLMNWQTEHSSFADEMTHAWGEGRRKYIEDLITDLQNPMGEQQDLVAEAASKLQSNYISSVFGFNPGIVVKQLGSIPMASAYLEWKHFPKNAIGKGKIDRELISRYTPDLDWRTMGYSMPETKQLKDAPNWSQKNKAVGLIFGGDAITAMDGWAASVLWPWAENKVHADFPGLEVGDAAMIESGQSPFYKKVAEVFNDAVARSQSVSDQMHQGRLRKSKNLATKALTMFRSDTAQSYNVLRQLLGEMDYYKRMGENHTELAEKTRAAVGAAVTAIAINSLWGTTVDLIVQALKGKLDDEEKEPMAILENFFWGVIESYAGLSAAGDILAELVGGWFTGGMRYDTEAPGVEQFNDIMQAMDKVVNAGKKGNWLGAVKTAAETIASYGGGIPVKNVEAYLKGILSMVLPGAVVGYEDMLKAPAKADLKGLEGDGLMVRLNNVLKGYGMKLDRESREAIAKLYEQGYTEAVPSAAPNSVTIEGVELELDERMRKAYDKTRGGIIERELAQIVGSAFFTDVDAKTQKSMLTKLYNYAAEKAKDSVLADYEISTSAQAIDEIIASGGSAADYAVFDAATAELKAWQKAAVLQEWGADEVVTRLMFKHLVSKSWEDELAELAKVQVDVGQFLELYAMHGEIDAQDIGASAKATNFAYWLDGQRYSDDQKTVIKDQMAFFQFMPAEASRYNAATAAGLDREQALDLTRDLDALEPPEGKTSVQDIQKYRVAIDNSVSESNQLRMLAAAGLKDASYDKVAKGLEMGVAPAAWVRVKEVQLQYDANGNGSMTNAEWEAAIEGICAYGIVLPGDTQRFNLTNEQKAVLWQMLVSKSTKATNNPFSPEAGRRWREAMGYE